MTIPIRILIRCDGSSKVGMGHIIRCLTLADELSASHGCKVAFAMREGRAGIDLVKVMGYNTFASDTNDITFEYSAWLFDIIEEFKPQMFIMDVRDDLPLSLVKKVKERGIKITTIDDPSDRRIAADLAFYPPVPQIDRMDWTRFEGELYVGWEWIILRPEFQVERVLESNPLPVILVTMGGSDPMGMTLTTVQAIEQIREDFVVWIVIGPAFSHHGALLKLLQGARYQYQIFENVGNMASIMREADIAVVAFGVTAYELAAVNVPAVYLCSSPDHDESAAALVAMGYGVNLGDYGRVTPSALCKAIVTLMQQRYMGAVRGDKTERIIDGLGSKRIAQRIVMEIQSDSHA